MKTRGDSRALPYMESKAAAGASAAAASAIDSYSIELTSCVSVDLVDACEAKGGVCGAQRASAAPATRVHGDADVDSDAAAVNNGP